MASTVPTVAQEGVFSDRLRRGGTVYVAVTVPLVALLASFLHGERAYLLAFVVAGALYTLPAFAVTWMASTRAPEADRPMWRVWFLGLVFTSLIGAAILVLVLTDWELLRQGGSVAVVAGTVVYGTAIMMMIRARSGARALSVDVIEDRMLMLLVAAPVALVFGDRIVTSHAAWFAVPAALAAAGMVSSIWLSISLFTRLDRGNRRVEGLGIALAIVGVICSCTQVAQGVSDFTLPFGPIIGLHALCLALVLLVPLHLPKMASAGLDRLPLQQQVRGTGVVLLATLVVLPILGIETYLLREQVRWAVPFTMAVVALLFGLSTLRHLLTIKETKRLYARVEHVAEERRLLLAAVMQGAEADRHRVAAQLHEQAVSSYAAFVSIMGFPGDRAASGVDAGPSTRLRRDLNRQAETLRELMLAIRPLETSAGAAPGSGPLELPLRAFVDSLYGDRRAPELTIVVDPELALDWATETVVLRIVQEAIRNVWRHAHATRLEISLRLRAPDDVIEVSVGDDGIGFDPASIIETGIASMRSFAAFHGGTVTVTSALGRGTLVVACLGDAVSPAERLAVGGPDARAAVVGADAEPRLLDLRDDADDGAVETVATSPNAPGRPARRRRLHLVVGSTE
jgi:signal transduction histidine kinase